MTRFLHTADWQLGMVRHYLAGDAQPRYSAARRDAVSGLGALAAQTGAEFVVVAGDVFEANQLDPEVISRSLEAMRSIGVPVYLLPGNHDPLGADSIYTSKLFAQERPDNVTVLDRAGVFAVRPGLEIVAAPWRSKRPLRDLAADALIDLSADGTVRVLVAHGGVDRLDPDPTNPSLIRLERLEEAIDRGVLHYVALGDKHSRTAVGDTGRIWYSGSPEVTNWDDIEPDPGHVLVVDIDEAAATHPVCVESRTVGTWRFVTLRRNIDTAGDIEALDAELDNLPNKERTAVRLELTGTVTVTERAALDHCVHRHGRVFAWLDLWRTHCDLAVVPADKEFSDLGFGGFAADAVEELVETARGTDREAAADAQGALALLLRLSGKGTAAETEAAA